MQITLANINRDHEAIVKKAFDRSTDRNKRLYQPLIQVMTGNQKIEVKTHPSRSMTNGKEVWLRVALELGLDTEHEKEYCDKRDPETMEMLCAACAVLDEADANAFHETGHIAHESFSKIKEVTKRQAFEKLLEQRIVAPTPELLEKATNKLRKAVDQSRTAMELAGMVDCWLPRVTNIAEDIFVDSRTVAARAGTAASLYAHKRKVLTKGWTDTATGEPITWAEQEVNARATMVVYALGAGLDFIIPSLGDEVQELAADPELKHLITSAPRCLTAEDRFLLAMDILEVLRKHNFCIDSGSILVLPKPPPQPPQGPEPQPCESEEESDDDSEEEPGEGAGDGGGKADEEDDEDEEGGSSPAPEADESDDGETDVTNGGKAGGLTAEQDSDEKDEDGDDEGQGADDDEDEDGEGSGNASSSQDSDEDDDDEADDEEGTGNGDDQADDSDEDEDGFEGTGNGGDEADEDSDDDEEGTGNGGGLDDDEDYDDEEEDDADGDGFGDDDEDFDDADDGEADSDDGEYDDEKVGEDRNTRPAMDDEPEDHDLSGVDDAYESKDDEKIAAAGAEAVLDRFMDHDPDKGEQTPEEEELERELQELAKLYFEQKDFFDQVSPIVRKVNVRRPTADEMRYVTLNGAPGTSEVMPSLNSARIAFTNNRKIGIERNLKKGKRLDGAHLSRLVTGDPRVFANRAVPKKRDWFVSIACDVSGSTEGGIDKTIAKGAFAMAELLQALGIKFAIHGHSGDVPQGSYRYNDDDPKELVLIEVKRPDDFWDTDAKTRCMALTGFGANLDGHTLEYHRRLCLAQRATEKLIMYFTDGDMPAWNYAEEVDVLQSNLRKCQRQGVQVVGIGVGNTEPRKHGLECIRYDSLDDLPALIKGLADHLV